MSPTASKAWAVPDEMLCLTFSKAFAIPDLVASGSGLSNKKNERDESMPGLFRACIETKLQTKYGCIPLSPTDSAA